MNDTWDVRCDEKRGDGETDPNPCPLSRSGPFHFLEASDTVSDKSHQPWGIVTGNNSGQDARAAGDSNHRRPGESLVAHEAPVPLSFAPNAWPSSTVIQGYTFSRVSVPSKNSRRLRLRLRPRARRPCRCPPPPLTPRASRHRDIAAGTNTPPQPHPPIQPVYRNTVPSLSSSRRCPHDTWTISSSGLLELRRRLRHNRKRCLPRHPHPPPWLPSANMSESARWILLKQDGNKKYQAGDYEGAEALYTKAYVAPLQFVGRLPLTLTPSSIIVNPDSPILYTNRTMARLKMKMWESAISDCNECLRIFPDNMKAHYYLGQAHLELGNYEEALECAQKAYKMCVDSNDKSLSAALALVRMCKSKRWDELDRRRRREHADLEGEVLALLERERDAAVGPKDGDAGTAQEGGDDTAIRAEWETKLEAMRDVFEKARAAESKRRKVPDWAIDDISFEFMHDPVVVSIILRVVPSRKQMANLSDRPSQASRTSARSSSTISSSHS